MLQDFILRALGPSIYLRSLRRVAIFRRLCASLDEGCFGGESGS